MEIVQQQGKLPPLGTVLALLLATPRRELESSISRSGGASNGSARHLEFLLRHLNNLVDKGASIEPVCVPLLEKVVSSNSRKKALLLLQMIFHSERTGEPLAKALGEALSSSQKDRGIKLAACTVVRELLMSPRLKLEQETACEATEGISLHVSIFANFLDSLVELVARESVYVAEKKAPTQLPMGAADCVLIITKLLAAEEPGTDPIPSSTILWEHLRNLSTLISELYEWNLWTRRIYAKGLLQIKRLLRDLTQLSYDENDRLIGMTLLKLCWKEYTMLMYLERDALLPRFKTYIPELVHAFQHLQSRSGGISKYMQRHILACLALVIGQMNSATLNTALENFREQLFSFLLAQLKSNVADAVEVAVELLKEVYSDAGMEARLVDLLSDQEVITAAAGHFIAERLVHSPAADMERVFELLDSKDAVCRKNAMETVIQILVTVSESDISAGSSWRHLISRQLLKRLDDEEFVSRLPSFSIFGMLDPESVIPQLIELVSDSVGKLRSTSSKALSSVFQYHSNQQKTICLFLDNLRSITTSKQQLLSKQPDLNVLMRLVSAWASEVKDWQPLIIFLLNKMFAEPSNAVMPRFMSAISNHLADMYMTVFSRVLEAMEKADALEMSETTLFSRLSPLLVLKVLPLRAYEHLDSEDFYDRHPSISGLLMKWMCEPYENDAVRRLSAQLVGLLIPQVVRPLLLDLLKSSVACLDNFQIIACIYAICNSLMVRGHCKELASNVQPLLTDILLWPTTTDEIQKVQHGCIDCLAVMICAECSINTSSILDEVLTCLSSSSRRGSSFYICMANVLISATSKVPRSCHGLLSDKIFPVVIELLEAEKEPVLRTALIQVLFSAAHNLKDAQLLPYANNLLAISLSALQSREGLPEERFCGAKLLASIVANESLLSVIGSSLKEVREALPLLPRNPQDL